MHSTQTPDLLKYSVTPIEVGFLLSIWEPAPVTDQRVKPFLFRATHRLPSEMEAQAVLQTYLTAYQLLTVDSDVL